MLKKCAVWNTFCILLFFESFVEFGLITEMRTGINDLKIKLLWKSTVEVSIYQRGDWNNLNAKANTIGFELKWVSTKEVTETFCWFWRWSHCCIEVSIYQRGDRAAQAETLITPKRWRLAARVSIYGHAQCKEVTGPRRLTRLLLWSVEGWPPARVSTKEVTETLVPCFFSSHLYVEVSIYQRGDPLSLRLQRAGWNRIRVSWELVPDTDPGWVSTATPSAKRWPGREGWNDYYSEALKAGRPREYPSKRWLKQFKR